MSDESLSKNFDFKILQDFKGYVSSVDPTKVDEKVMVKGSQNIYKKLSGTLSVREGMKRRGAANAAVSPISSEFVWNTSRGAVYPLMISDSNLYVEYNDVWYSLLSGLTKTRYVFDKWWNYTEEKDRVLFVKGDSDIQHWSGGVAEIGTTTANTIQLFDTTSTWIANGFSSTAGELTIVINGTTYTYTGGQTTNTLTGVTPSPAGEASGSIAIQSVLTKSNTPATGFKNDFIKVINNRLFVGSYTSRFCYISSSSDWTNFTIPGTIVPGSPNLATLDSNLKGIAVKDGSAYIGYGAGEWAVITFPTYTNASGVLCEQRNVEVKPISKLAAPYAHEFIGNSGNNIIYLAQDQQLRELGEFNNLFTTGYPSLSQEIATELSQEDFVGGGLKCIGDYVYLTAPVSGKVYLYQVRQSVDNAGNVVAERLWHSPMIWNATRIDEISGVTYAYSNANPQIYQIWNTQQWHDDSPTDEPLPYACILALSYRTGNRRQGLITFDKIFSEGYISTGTTLNLTINYGYEGYQNIVVVPINTALRPAYVMGGQSSTPTSPGSLGDDSLGDSPIGDGISDAFIDDLAKFKVIDSLSLINCFEYQPIYKSDTADARWELLAVGTNARIAEQESSFIINK